MFVLIQGGLVTFALIAVFFQFPIVIIVNIFDSSYFVRLIIAALMGTVLIKIFMMIKKRGKLSTFDEI